MKKKGWKKWAAGCACIIAVLLCGCLSALARTEGSITLQFPEEAVGAQLTLYMVADYTDEEGYLFREAFAGSGVVIADLNDTAQTQDAAEKLAACAQSEGLEGQSVTVGESRQAAFRSLEPGLYLSVQTGGQRHVLLQPSLIPVPYLMAEGDHVYDVVLSPKYSVPGGAVIVTKVDDSGAVLAQAHFTVQQKIYSEEGNVLDGMSAEQDEKGIFYWKEFTADLVSGENGQIVLKDLPMGDYRLMETQSPSGCILKTAPYEFSIEEPGTVVEVSGVYQEESGTVAELRVVNERTTLRVNKVDGEGKPVVGARLAVKDANGQMILDENGSPRYSFTTTDQPYELKGLAAGEYFISELEAPDGYMTAQDVKLTLSDAADAVNEITMVDERQQVMPGRLTVRKELCDLDGNLLMVEDSTFYVALFADAGRQNRISNVEAIRCLNSSSGSVTFENLVPGQTYYLGETDAFGSYIENGVYEDCLFVPEYPDGYEIKPAEAGESTVSLRNVFHEIPHGYYFEGELTITKEVLKGTSPYASDQTFYAAIYTDSNCTEQYGELIELDMDGAETLSVTVPVAVGSEPDEEVVYYVAETDKNGKKYDSSSHLEFQVSQDKSSVRMTQSENSAEVKITNTYPEETEKTEKTEMPEKNGEPGEPGGTGGSAEPTGGTGTVSRTPVRTGDDTPIMIYLVVLCASAVVIFGLLVIRRKRKIK